MSEQNMQELDNEVLRITNSAGEARSAEEARQRELDAELRKKTCRAQAVEEQKRKEEKAIAEMRTKCLLKLIVQAAGCLLAITALVLTLLDTQVVPVVAYTGIAVALIAGTVTVDRYWTRWH